MNPNDPTLKDIGAQIEAKEAEIAAALALDPPGDVTALEAELEALEVQMKDVQAHRAQVIADRKAARKP